MKQNNSRTFKLFIATEPANETDKKPVQLIGISSFTTTKTATTADQKYYSNFGEVVKIVTGGSQSASVSIDYDNEDPLHIYLLSLAKQDFDKYNNQYVVFEESNLGIPTNYKYGKSCIVFKTIPTTGAPDELVKLEFDIFPQDDRWTANDENKPAWFPDPATVNQE